VNRSAGAQGTRQLAAEAAEARVRMARTLAGRAVFATLRTSRGSIHMELFPRSAPHAVANFVGLATGAQPYLDDLTGERRMERYFDGLRFHRVIRGSLLQTGDRTDGMGDGGPGYTFNDEYAPDLTFNRPYLVAMTNDGKRSDGSGTNGSQFFITLAPATHLNFSKPIFGELSDDHSRRLADELGMVPTDPNYRPVEPITIRNVEVVLDIRPEG
jgi:peptidyl-prolyl cis-trans isomerase A (cyclophilin A)